MSRVEITLASLRAAHYEPDVLWNAILGGLAGLSAVLGLWQWVAARRFPLHRRVPVPDTLPGVTVLKPLKGCDAFTQTCLRSWFQLDYPGAVQLLLGVASEADPVSDAVRTLLRQFPEVDASLVICSEVLGANAKVSTLTQLQPHAKHEVIAVSDADVCVAPDLLANVILTLVNNAGAADGVHGAPAEESLTAKVNGVGLVSCPYRLANPSTLAMRWEAIAVNADFWSQVLQSNTLKPMDFALGAVMAFRRDALEAIGGFRALVDCLADDYQLGNRIVKKGWRAELCSVIVDCWDPPQGWGRVWEHQLRWSRTMRVCQPVPYLFSILNNATFWPLLWMAILPSASSMGIGFGLIVLRVVLALDLLRRLTPGRSHLGWFWLVPLKDLMGVVIWAGAFLGNRIVWRGERMRLRRDGTLRTRSSERGTRN